MEGLEAKLHHVLAGSESPKTLTLEKTKKEEKEDTDPARDEQRDVHQDARWSKLSEAKQARLLEQCFSKLYGIPKPKARTLPQRPSKRWLMQTPCTAEPGELGHLCEICRHVDFHYLVNCPLAQVLESFKLFPLKWPLLRQEDCAFCRLVAKTVRGALGDRQIMTEAQGKDIMCDFRMLPKAVKTAGRAEMILRLIPQPQGIDDFTYLVLSEYHAEQDVMKRMTNHGVSVEVPRVDCEMIKRWCHRCVSGQCGSNPSVIQDRDLPHGFRLIDVSQQCVVAYKQGDQYVTLSYVWGGVATLRNTKALCKDLAVSGALIHEKHRLPNTIKDAMALVEMLGERYIWVDSLCIIQDDEDDKAIQIAAMDQIYSSSVLTLVAASGDNADVGLPGMSAGPLGVEQPCLDIAREGFITKGPNIRLSRTKPSEQTDRGEEDPDLLVDEEAVTMEKTSFPDRPDVEKSKHSCACDQRRFDVSKPWCLYNVMLVEWEAQVAYWMGLGTVHIDAWAQATPSEKIITLG